MLKAERASKHKVTYSANKCLRAKKKYRARVGKQIAKCTQAKGTAATARCVN